MGTWDAGPFDNDGAADFLIETGGSAAALAQLLMMCVSAPADAYLDVDDGQPVIAACELIALGFGYGNLDTAPAKIKTLARALGPNEKLRTLALRALPRIRDPEHSEVADLWSHEPKFHARLESLARRLAAAGD